ncbi:MAG: hypothetical protein H0V92_05940 [Pseudonocardiales bacterium]|nr:hypothetical protein [Pseudonocardiales bacterium]
MGSGSLIAAAWRVPARRLPDPVDPQRGVRQPQRVADHRERIARVGFPAAAHQVFTEPGYRAYRVGAVSVEQPVDVALQADPDRVEPERDHQGGDDRAAHAGPAVQRQVRDSHQTEVAAHHAGGQRAVQQRAVQQRAGEDQPNVEQLMPQHRDRDGRRYQRDHQQNQHQGTADVGRHPHHEHHQHGEHSQRQPEQLAA